VSCKYETGVGLEWSGRVSDSDDIFCRACGGAILPTLAKISNDAARSDNV